MPRWNLGQIVPGNDFEGACAAFEDRLPEYRAWLTELSPSMNETRFREYLEFDDAMRGLFGRIDILPVLRLATNQGDAEARMFKARAENLGVKLEDATRPIEHWYCGLPVEAMARLDDKAAAHLFAAAGVYAESLRRERAAARHLLSGAEERLVNRKDAALLSAINDLSDLLRTETKFSFKVPGQKGRRLLEADIRAKFWAEGAAERAAAHDGYLSGHQAQLQRFFILYQGIVRNWAAMKEARGHSSAISVMNEEQWVPNEAIDALLASCVENRTVFQEYFRWKAARRGDERLARADIFAPVGAYERNFTYEEALRLVLTAFNGFSPTFREHAERIALEGHVDTHPRPGKNGGVFCFWSGPQVGPYILLNHHDRLEDLYTIGHEFGHGAHVLYASHLPNSLLAIPDPLAETASTLGELLVFEHLVGDATRAERETLYAQMLESTFATVLRQAYFVRFEQLAHEMIPAGTDAEKLSGEYAGLLREQFGDAVVVPDAFRHEWTTIPHIFRTPFYCTSYCFGQLFSLSLFGQYKERGAGAVPMIESVLAAGGSREPAKLLAEQGSDISSRAFWQSSFRVIEGWLGELTR